MDLAILKNPVVLAVLAGSVLVTNVVTYNVSAPSADYCSAEISDALDNLRQQMDEDQADLERALKPNEGLNPNRGGGINWKDSIR